MKPYFSSPSLSKQLKLAHHLIGYSDSLLVVTGVEGSGKTRFLHETTELAGDWRICLLEGREIADIEALMSKLTQHFAIAAASESDSDRSQGLRELFRRASRPAGAVVLLVDDAQLLAPDVLELLVELACSEEKDVLRLVLAAAPIAMAGIQQLAQQRGAGQRVHGIEMPTLDEEETADFLHLLVSEADWSGDSPFDDALVHDIYQRSNGLPGRICAAAKERLQPSLEVASGTAGLASRLGVWGLIAVVLLLGSWSLFRNGTEAPEKSLSEPVLPPQAATQPEPLIAVIAEAPVAVVDNAEPQLEVEVSPAPIVRPLPAKVPVATEDENPTPPERVANVPFMVRTELELAVTESAEDADTIVATPASEPAAAALAKHPVVLESTVNTAPVVPKALAALHDLSWLAKQNSKHHTVQIFATHHLKSLRKFVISRSIGQDFAWFETVHRGQPWYVLVRGVYPERNAARVAIASLPSALKKAKPWIRSIASITATATSPGQ